jgi:uncharacterized protein (DUF302 family)
MYTLNTQYPQGPATYLARRLAMGLVAAGLLGALAGCAANGMRAAAAPASAAPASPAPAPAISNSVGTPAGLVAIKSPHSAAATMARLEEQVKQRGLAVVAKVDHAAGAVRVGKTLRPTELLIFGNPQGGTPLMECAQTAGIDLPLKALVWQDAAGQVWLGYNDPAYLAQRHQAAACQAVDNLRKALAGLAEATVKP